MSNTLGYGDFIAAGEKEQAQAELQDLVNHFNSDFSDWEELTSFGANFGFEYDPKLGRKKMIVLDIAPVDPKKPVAGDERIGKAGEVLDTALEETLESVMNPPKSEGELRVQAMLENVSKEIDEARSQMIPPGMDQDPSPGQPVIDSPGLIYPRDTEEYAPIAQGIQTELTNRAREGLVTMLTESMSSADLLLLSALGIDGRQQMLDLFIKECQALKEEVQNEQLRSS